nr:MULTISPECIES: 6-phosphogluconolactonase [Myxococcaceae]
MVQEAARRLARALQEAVQARGKASFATSGGSTPGPIHQALVALGPDAVPWRQVSFFFADERCVPPSSPDSNYRLARQTLLDPLGILNARVHRMEGEREDRDAAARDYAARLPEQLDVVLLGMGEDGHTASLFPGAPSLEEQSARVLAVKGPKPPPWRLTLTLPVLQAARTVLGVAVGAGKRDAVQRIRAGEALPASRVPQAEWLLDPAAAGQ